MLVLAPDRLVRVVLKLALLAPEVLNLRSSALLAVLIFVVLVLVLVLPTVIALVLGLS